MRHINWLWVSFKELPWWAELLWVVYLIYFVVRTYNFWSETKYQGLWKGYKSAVFDGERYFRIYHIILIIFDIPPAILGLTFPFLRKVLAFKIYDFEKNTKKESNG